MSRLHANRFSLRYTPRVERLEDRRMLAVTAMFTPASGVLSVFGDSLDNTIEISRNAAGALFVNGGAAPISGGAATVANTTLVQVFGLAGNDTITMNETAGALPRANLFGGGGQDVITGGSGNDMVFGQTGNDTLSTRGGSDFLFGGGGDDVLIGGDGDDLAFGQSGNDRMVWNPGDDTDLNEGGAGLDVVEVNGGGGAERFTTTANGARVRFDRLDPAPFSIDIGTSESLVVNMGGGNDEFSATGNLAALIGITVDGGAGNDTILGSNGADLLIGGDDDDFVDGQQGNDVVFLGAGNDTFQWDPGDGSDTVEGQAGFDTMVFNGSAAAEIMEIAANGGRVRFSRNVGSIVMDLDDVERINVNLLGGADTMVVNNLAGTDLAALHVSLALIGGAGDSAADNVIVNATSGEDAVIVSGTNALTSVLGLATVVTITGGESANDRLTVNLLAGDDVLDATGMAAGHILLTGDGGDNDDVLLGGDGPDTLLGGLGDDVLIGGPGLDVLDGGSGDDVEIQ